MPRIDQGRRVAHAVTPLGWFIVLVTIATLALARIYTWVEAGVVGVTGIIILVFSLPFLLGSRSYLVRLAVDKWRVTAGKPIVVSLFIRNPHNRATLPAIAELPVGESLHELSIPMVRPSQRVRLDRRVDTTHRGVITLGPLTLSRRDPLGLFHRETTWADWHTVHVHPPWVALPPITAGATHDLEGIPSSRLTVSDLSFHALREYVTGDSLRHVHWKSTARTGTLMVRQYEESQAARSAVIFDSNLEAYQSRPEFELGVSVTASLGLQAIRNGRERFIASGWHPPHGHQGINGLVEIPTPTPTHLLDTLTELHPTNTAPTIEEQAKTLADSGRNLSVVTLVSGSLTPIHDLRRAVTMFSPRTHVQVVRCHNEQQPALRMVARAVFYDIGYLSDLPLLLVQGVE